MLWGALLSICLAAGSAMAEATPAGEQLFDVHEMVTGIDGRHTVLPGFFLGGATAEIAVVHVDESGRGHLRLYGFDGGAWAPVLDATLGPGALFVDVARVGGRDRLIAYEAGRLRWFDPDLGEERVLAPIPASYRMTGEGGIPQVDVSHDLNGDGRDDLVIPDVEGFWISTQRSDGSFTTAARLGPAEPYRDHLVGNFDTGDGAPNGRRAYGEVGVTAETVPLYLSRLHRMDHDRDGRVDLVFWNQDHFEVHLQDESGRFEPRARTFTVDVPFDSDGVYSHAFKFSDQGVLGFLFGIGEKTRGTVLHSLRDLDGDGVEDLVTLTLSGRSINRQRSVYAVHYGSSTPGGVAFAPDPGAVIRPRGKAGAMQPWGYSAQRMRDLDGDGRVDLMFQDIRPGLGGMMRALLGNSVPIDLELYRAGQGTYGERPTVRREIRRCAPFAGIGNVFFPAVLVGDVNGDGRADLLVGRSPRELQVFLGVAGPQMLERRPHKVAIGLPPDEGKSRLADLNRDGKKDLLVLHTPTDRAPDAPYRLTALIAR